MIFCEDYLPRRETDVPEDEFDVNEVAEALMQVNLMIQPIIEFAAGLKAKLLSEGWSQEVADDVSGDVLKRMIALGMGGGPK